MCFNFVIHFACVHATQWQRLPERWQCRGKRIEGSFKKSVEIIERMDPSWFELQALEWVEAERMIPLHHHLPRTINLTAS